MKPLKTKLTESDKALVLAEYAKGYGVATVAVRLGFKSHCVERLIKESGLMRERKHAAAIAIRKVRANEIFRI